MSVMEMDILGFLDGETSARDLASKCSIDPCDMSEYEEAINKAMELAKEEGIWDESQDNNDPENCLIELETTYPELFEGLNR